MPTAVLLPAWPCVAARDENLTDAITTCTRRQRSSGQWLQSRDAFRPVPWDNFSSAIDSMRDVLWSRPGQFIPAKPDRHQVSPRGKACCPGPLHAARKSSCALSRRRSARGGTYARCAVAAWTERGACKVPRGDGTRRWTSRAPTRTCRWGNGGGRGGG